MLTNNQISDIFYQQVGRAPTAYEMGKYGGSSIQDLTGLKDIYSKYDPDTLPGYLASTGQDFSPVAISNFAKQYGIDDVTASTSQGQKTILNYLKTGSQPNTQPIGGSITQPATGQQYDTKGNPIPATENTFDNPAPVGGSVSGAAGSAVDTDPDVSAAKQSRDDAYNIQQTKQKAIADIDNSIANSLSEKIAEVKAGGGRIDEASIRSQVYNENQPLLAQRKQLVSEYTTANNNYQKANSDLNLATNNFYKNITASQKQQQIGQGQEKINVQQQQFTEKQQQQQTQFEQSLTQKGIKYLKFTDPDTGQIYYIDQSTGETIDGSDASFTTPASTTAPTTDTITTPDGKTHDLTGYATDPNHTASVQTAINNIGKLNTPQDITNYIQNNFPNSPITAEMVENASQKYGVDWETILGIMQQESSMGTAGVAVKTFNPGNVGNIDNGSTVSYKSWQDGVNAVAQWIANKDNSQGSMPWNTTDASLPPVGDAANKECLWIDPVTNKAVDTGRTINYVFQSAVTLAMDKSATPQKFLGGLSGNSGPGKALKNALSDKSAALMAASGVLQPVLQQEFSANSKAITTQVGYLNSISRALNGAEKGAQLTQKLFADKNINTDSSTWKNKTINDLVKAFDSSADIRAYQSAMVEIGNEYAQVFARGGQRSVQGNQLAQDVINGNVKLSDIQETLTTLQAIGQTVVDTTIENVRSIAGGGGTDSVASFLSYVYGGKTEGGQTGGGNQPSQPDTFNDGTNTYKLGADGLYYKQ